MFFPHTVCICSLSNLLALWLVGDDWPHRGEVDILEGWGGKSNNQITLHTGYSTVNGQKTSDWNCDMDFSSNGRPAGSHNCWGGGGCGMPLYEDPKSYGQPFNDVQGGVFVYERVWGKVGKGGEMRVFFIPCASASQFAWGDSLGADRERLAQYEIATFTSDKCDLDKYLWEQRIILNITFCSGYGSIGVSGGEEECKKIVGGQPGDYANGFWELGNIHIYKHCGQGAVTGP
jgi:hypothetical protein